MPPIMSRQCEAGCVILLGAGLVVTTFIFNAFVVFMVLPLYNMGLTAWRLLLDTHRGAYGKLCGYS